MNTGQLETVAVWIEAAERAPARDQGAGAVEAGIASLREIHHYKDGDVSGAVEAGRRSVEQGDTPWRPLGHDNGARRSWELVRAPRAPC